MIDHWKQTLLTSWFFNSIINTRTLANVYSHTHTATHMRPLESRISDMKSLGLDFFSVQIVLRLHEILAKNYYGRIFYHRASMALSHKREHTHTHNMVIMHYMCAMLLFETPMPCHPFLWRTLLRVALFARFSIITFIFWKGKKPDASFPHSPL